MIYVDSIIIYPNAKPPFNKGSCHLFTENRYVTKELLDFAKKIGLKREWLQNKKKKAFPHFDLTINKRYQAVRAGAKEISISDMYKILLKNMKEIKEGGIKNASKAL